MSENKKSEKVKRLMGMQTVDDLYNDIPRADYTREQMRVLWSGREALTPIEILDLSIPYSDRLEWVLKVDVIGERACQLLEQAYLDHAPERIPSAHPRDIELARASRSAGVMSRRWSKCDAGWFALATALYARVDAKGHAARAAKAANSDRAQRWSEEVIARDKEGAWQVSYTRELLIQLRKEEL